MPRTFSFSPKLLMLKLSLLLICLAGWGVAETLALTPCGAPLKAGFRARTLDLPSVGINVSLSNVAVGDFNNDGRADAAVISSYYDTFSNRIYIFLGNAASGLTFSGTAITISQPTDIAVTEFNNDGKLDLIVNNGNTIQTLIGDGSGGFNPVITYSVTSHWLVTGDFNGDGKQDIAAAPRFATPGRISIFMGFGTGTYAAPFDTLTGDAPDDLKAADMNGDGKLDLVTVNGSNGVSVLLNNGSGGFSSPTHFSTSAVMANRSMMESWMQSSLTTTRA